MTRTDRIVFFDVENSGMVLEFEAYDLFRRGGHHPRPTDIKQPRRLFSFQAKPLGKKPIWHSAETPEAYDAMVRHMHDVLMETDILVGWNSEKFDWHKAQHAFFLLGLPRVPEPFQIDLMKVTKKHFDFESNSLAYVSRQLLPESDAKIHLDVPIKTLIDRIKAGDKRALTLLKQYGLRDVTVLEKLWPRYVEYLRLPHANPYAAAAEDGDRICPTCGGDDTISRGHRRTLQGAYLRRFCKSCLDGGTSWYTVTRAASMAHARGL